MKKFYVSIVVCFGLFIQGYGQDYYWVGPNGSNWNSASNWSGTAGGAGGFGVPTDGADNVIFTASATVVADVDAINGIELNSLTISGSNSQVTITTPGAGGDRMFTLLSTSASAPALDVRPNTALTFTSANNFFLIVVMETDSKGKIDGTLVLDGYDSDFYSLLTFNGGVSNSTSFDVSASGAILIKKTGESLDTPVDDILKLNAGSEIRFEDNKPIIPKATFDPASEIVITGMTNGEITFDEKVSVGKITYNCTSQTSNVILNLPHNIIVRGDLSITNTNSRQLILMSNEQLVFPTQSVWSVTFNDDLNISGNSRVAIADANVTNQQFTATVAESINAGGLAFSLQNNNNIAASTTLVAKGNILHTAGTFGANSTASNETNHLFIIEMNGGVAQTISSHNGFFDNTTHQVTFRINNAAGVLLQSDLAVGRLNFVSGKVNTAAHVLTVNNTSGESIVFNGFSSSNYITGAVARTVSTTNPVEFPVGSSSLYRPVTLTPTVATPTTFTVQYFNTGSGNNSFATPLEGIEQNYYYQVSRAGTGADAKVRLRLNGAVAGADAGDAIVVAKFDGTNWVRARGVSGVFVSPGDLTTGDAETDEQTSFGLYTFGYGAQAAVLPIKLESFNAKKVNSSAQINWRISENSNPVSFEVMKSGDGINFSKLGTVTAFDGKLNYNFTDNALLTGNNYYRLRMLDKDGIVSFSSIVVVMNGTKGVMISSMIPTMVVNRARLNITSSVNGNIQLVITDISGRVIQIQNASIISGNQEIWLNASRLSSGIFQVTGYMNGEKTATIRFFKR